MEKLKLIKEMLGLPALIVSAVAVVSPLVLKLANLDFSFNLRLSWFIVAVTVSATVGILAPRMIPGASLKRRSACAPRTWERLKQSIREFHTTSDAREKRALERRYARYRNLMIEVTAHHQRKILEELDAERPGATRYATGVLGNFRNTFSSASLDGWRKECSRNLEGELDCFDNIPYLIRKHA